MARPGSTDIGGRYNHDEDVKLPAKEGRSPRHATEPEGAEEAGRGSGTKTDPQTGEPARPAEKQRP